MWSVSRVKDRTLHQGEEWNVDTEFRKFQCDENRICILQFNYFRTTPGYCSGKSEFFVSEEFVKEKITLLRKNSMIKEFTWDPDVGTWREVHKKKYYRKPSSANKE
jgi:hypothetical protein